MTKSYRRILRLTQPPLAALFTRKITTPGFPTFFHQSAVLTQLVPCALLSCTSESFLNWILPSLTLGMSITRYQSKIKKRMADSEDPDKITHYEPSKSQSDASYQISYKLAFRFRRINEKNRFSRWWPWRPCWISERNDFSYFCSTSHIEVFYQVSSQFAFRFRRKKRKIFSRWQP